MSRHSLKIPYVKFVEFGSNFIRNGNKWNLLIISWKVPASHPGYFIIKVLDPIHNGYKSERLFTEIPVEQHQIYLDEYEDFFIGWCSGLLRANKYVARDSEIKVAAWETYLYCYDSLLVNYARMEELLVTVDQDKTMIERAKAIDDVILKLQDSFIVEHWNNVMKKYIINYNHWLPLLMDCLNG
jgi:hypothetical protein